MKILILYASKNGVTKQCAKMLADILNKRHQVTLCSAKEEKLPSPAGFDVAAIGSSVRMGGINKKIKKYLKENAEGLSKINTAVFLCCGNAESFEEYCALSIPKKLEVRLGKHYFGGELKPEKLKGLDKLIVKMVRGSIKTKNFENSQLDQIALPEIIPENIIRLADSIRDLL